MRLPLLVALVVAAVLPTCVLAQMGMTPSQIAAPATASPSSISGGMPGAAPAAPPSSALAGHEAQVSEALSGEKAALGCSSTATAGPFRLYPVLGGCHCPNNTFGYDERPDRARVRGHRPAMHAEIVIIGSHRRGSPTKTATSE